MRDNRGGTHCTATPRRVQLYSGVHTGATAGTVRTTRGSGWPCARRSHRLTKSHPLPRVVLTCSNSRGRTRLHAAVVLNRVTRKRDVARAAGAEFAAHEDEV